MQNAHLRRGQLEHLRSTANIRTSIRLQVDRYMRRGGGSARSTIVATSLAVFPATGGDAKQNKRSVRMHDL